MPPWQGGGAMIDEVRFDHVTFANPPQRFEAGTPHIVGAVGLHAAIRWVEEVGIEAIDAHERALVSMARAGLAQLNSVGCSARTTAPASCRSQWATCTRTMSPPYWTKAASRSAPATTAPSR
jgi:cysteine desulfurase / selenocysteine lyase